MEYFMFTLWFTVIHTVCYTLAGAIALRISRDIYEGKARMMDYLRDMNDKEESFHVQKWFLPASCYEVF